MSSDNSTRQVIREPTPEALSIFPLWSPRRVSSLIEDPFQEPKHLLPRDECNPGTEVSAFLSIYLAGGPYYEPPDHFMDQDGCPADYRPPYP